MCKIILIVWWLELSYCDLAALISKQTFSGVVETGIFMTQYDAAVRYLEKKDIKKAAQNAFHVLLIVSFSAFVIIMLCINLLYK